MRTVLNDNYPKKYWQRINRTKEPHPSRNEPMLRKDIALERNSCSSTTGSAVIRDSIQRKTAKMTAATQNNEVITGDVHEYMELPQLTGSNNATQNARTSNVSRIIDSFQFLTYRSHW